MPTPYLRRTYVIRAKYPGCFQIRGFAGLVEGLIKTEEPLIMFHLFGEEGKYGCYTVYTTVDVSRVIGMLIEPVEG